MVACPSSHAVPAEPAERVVRGQVVEDSSDLLGMFAKR
jgi:hypothetical protein